MASNINTSNIDIDYPVAGQDNDSQGFRDNFRNIKDGLDQTKSEITSLQSTSPDLSANNNFNGYVVQNLNLKDVGFQSPSASYSDANDTIDYSLGQYQRAIISQDTSVGTVSLTFSNFPPAGQLGKLRLHITAQDTIIDDAKTVKFQFSIPTNNIYVKKELPGVAYADLAPGDAGPNLTRLNFPFEIDDKDAVYIFDVWSVDALPTGVPQSIFVEYVGEFKEVS
jgi:hypothetical protein